MQGHDLIVIGASAGGVEALRLLMAGLPADLPAAVCVVLHLPAHSASALPHILSRAGCLPAVHVQDGQPIQPGRVYVAPPDSHLIVMPNRLRLARGPRENGHRPAIDPLFRSAARAYGPRVIGVVLSGTLDDGTAGLLDIKARGGLAVAQDPADASYASMPQSAVDHVALDAIEPLTSLAATLLRLVRQPIQSIAAGAADPALDTEVELAVIDSDALNAIDPDALNAIGAEEHPGKPSGFGCPECGGALWELGEGDLTRFRCRVGHAYSARSLLTHQSDALEQALWTALRALEERADLSRQLMDRANRRGHRRSSAYFCERLRHAEQQAAIIRQTLLDDHQRGEAEQAAATLALDRPPGTTPPAEQTEHDDGDRHGD